MEKIKTDKKKNDQDNFRFNFSRCENSDVVRLGAVSL